MSSCVICSKHKDVSRQSLIVYSDENWVVYHSLDTNILGYFCVEPKRHFLDLSDATAEEAAGYGPLLLKLMSAVRAVVDPLRIYTFSLGETVAHYHLHVIPRRHDFPRTYSGRGIMSYPTTPGADPALMEEVCRRVRRHFKSGSGGRPASLQLSVTTTQDR
jgi:diadenosine tetraphosphate (Ap4A) HIT family hydrolase